MRISVVAKQFYSWGGANFSLSQYFPENVGDGEE
jgi:hypothetical protein